MPFLRISLDYAAGGTDPAELHVVATKEQGTHLIRWPSTDKKTFLFCCWPPAHPPGLSLFPSLTEEERRSVHLFHEHHDIHSPVKEDAEHHTALYYEIDLAKETSPQFLFSNDNVRFNYRPANLPAMYGELLNADWSSIETTVTGNEACLKLYDIINTAQKNNYRIKYKEFKTPTYLDKFKQLRGLTKQQIKVSYAAHVKNTEDAKREEPTKCWS
nr:unnamed protein product [Callosobruchus analis]